MATRVREKAKARKENAEKRPHARARYIRIAPRKVRIVINLIRGKHIDEALAILMYTPKAASPVVEKLVRSAIANAENNLSMSRDNLFVAEIWADAGPTLKRGQPHGRGSMYPIMKRSSHITVILDQVG